jgi:electron transport complex protein RnfG
MSTLQKTMTQAATVLTLFSVLGGGLVVLSFHVTEKPIIANERLSLLRNLNEIISPDQYDNDLFSDNRDMTNEALLGTKEPVTLYRARKNGQPVAVVLTVVAPDGYNGNIRLLIGIHYEGVLAGVRVISHQETPGLGDIIELRKSKWMLGFNGRSLNNPQEGKWKVRKDGGIFDHLTGATITPRAVVKAVKNTLQFYREFREEVFAEEKQ